MAKNKKQKKTGSRAYRIIYAILAGIIGVIFNYKIINKEKEPDKSGFIVCANHVSATDAIALCYAFKKNQVHFMAKKELFKIPLLSGLIKLLGAFPVDRKGSDVGAIKKAIATVKEGKSVGIFPQGHRYPKVDPRSTPIKNGSGLIISRAECDVVPVYILRKKNTFRLFKKTYVIIGDKIDFATLKGKDNAEITNIVFDAICTIGENSDIKL